MSFLSAQISLKYMIITDKNTFIHNFRAKLFDIFMF